MLDQIRPGRGQATPCSAAGHIPGSPSPSPSLVEADKTSCFNRPTWHLTLEITTMLWNTSFMMWPWRFVKKKQCSCGSHLQREFSGTDPKPRYTTSCASFWAASKVSCFCWWFHWISLQINMEIGVFSISQYFATDLVTTGPLPGVFGSPRTSLCLEKDGADDTNYLIFAVWQLDVLGLDQHADPKLFCFFFFEKSLHIPHLRNNRP